ncbi:PREDICTED: neurofilament heavy polypeptide-like isoform X2 [Camelina sativa]|nr:PREDICTED: neurofilament heavy polypeptide-like isoform X2 [Camelina sativa]
MDSEAIYQKFVLRVMAARSPSVRLRKALYRKDFSVDPKCPNTVPAKPSRSRVSRLAMISAIPQKGNGNVIRSKEVKVVPTKKNVTPKAKVSSVISSVPQKALTERKKQMKSPAAFRSVQNPRNATTKVSENRVVAKALVFQSPKKLVKLKRSVELSSSVKKLCNGMRKLEIENKSNGLGVNHKVVSSVPSRRPLKTREVKSRVFDSVRSQKQNDSNTKGVSTLKKRVKKKEEPVLSSDASKAHEANGKELENQSLPGTEKTSGDEELVVQNKSEELSDTLKANMNNQLQATEDPAVVKESAEIEEKENALALECEDKENATIAAAVDREDISVIKVSGLNKAKHCETVETEDKENALPLECENKENATNATDVDREGDDKENSSALDNNRKVDQATYPLLKKKVFGKKENCKTTQKVMTVADKCFNGKTVSAGTRVKYTKPKLTNPKPFRLRTDERQILKEAHTEKKPQCTTLAKEETASIMGFHSENLGPKHHPVRVEKNTTSQLKAPRGTSTTLVSENMINSKRVALGRKKQVARKGIETVEETSQMNGESKEVAVINKPSVCVLASGEKRPATVPKGPNFHSIHLPKSCTKRLASQA